MALRRLLSEEEALESPQGAGQRRASAQELALAVASLEQRHAEAAQTQAGLLSVDEAVRELNLPLSPQELWAEVQARRGKIASDMTTPSRARLWFEGRKKAAGFTFATALLASLITYALQAGSLANETPKFPSHRVTLADIAQAEVVHEPTPHGIRLCTLAEVPDNAAVTVNADTLSLDNMYVDQNIQDDAPEWLPVAASGGPPCVWRIVRHGGRLYVRGWAAYDVSASAARLSGITLYSTPTALGGGHRMLPLTLRATRSLLGDQNMMTSRATGAGWESIHFDRVRLDKHARDGW